MRKSNWESFLPKFRDENSKKYLSCHHLEYLAFCCWGDEFSKARGSRMDVASRWGVFFFFFSDCQPTEKNIYTI